MRIGVLGGTGPQGQGLALRLAMAGHRVALGSRQPHRAETVAAALRSRTTDVAVLTAGSNDEVATDADVVILSVPFTGQLPLLGSLAPILAGKIVVTCVNPLAFDEHGPYALMVPEGSAAEQAALALPDSVVVAAFHHVSAPTLLEPDRVVDETVLVCGDEAEAKRSVITLASAVTARGGVDSGPLRNAQQVEALTAVLIGINRRYQTRSGIAITGITGADER